MIDQRRADTSGDSGASFLLVCRWTQTQPYIVAADADVRTRTHLCEVVNCAMPMLNES